MASACPPPIPFPAQNPPCRQDVCKPSRQKSHVPSDQAKGAMTKSPFFNVDTSRPVSSTTPTNSWAHRGTTGRGRHVVVRVQVRAANARPDDPHDRVRRLLQCRIGHGLDSNVSGAVHDGCSHGVSPLASGVARFEVDVSAWTGRLQSVNAGASRARECLLFQVTAGTSLGLLRSSNVNCMDNRAEIREFLSSRRARITPEQAGLPALRRKPSRQGVAP